ncbi:hypothetical protein [Flavimarina sp. Hel_I_48]|uniref:hypothetical protein n=1 Tax=Flavimarina sp. Hel_I_48 TaxID=1392488 RepID=UPI0004DF2F54|nr:hypothetical protein [Flavimarina sp. Hel_I_48]
MNDKPEDNVVETDAYLLRLSFNYAHLVYLSKSYLDVETLQEVRLHLKKYYKDRNFVLINERINDIVINPKYHRDSLKNMIAVAVVSTNDKWRERLHEEQKNSSRSFAFFKNLKCAQLWADHFMEYQSAKN